MEGKRGLSAGVGARERLVGYAPSEGKDKEKKVLLERAEGG
jgi:ribosomal protein S15P/S13E